MGPSITGQERVHKALEIALKLIETITKISNSNLTEAKIKRLTSMKARLSKKKQLLVRLSTKARDPVTRYYANIALKEISQKSINLK